eukprot:scaffold16285_cov31-Tisochrysis_lutea.AAC.3
MLLHAALPRATTKQSKGARASRLSKQHRQIHKQANKSMDGVRRPKNAPLPKKHHRNSTNSIPRGRQSSAG